MNPAIPTVLTDKNLRRFMLACLFLGVAFRLFQITRNDFYLYDEGYYLSYNRLFLQLMSQHFPSNGEEWKLAVLVWFRFSLATGKALWFLLADSRIFFGGMKAFFFPRVLSSLAGIATLAVTYLFAKRFFESKRTAFLSVALLAVLPSHVFYSRLAFQEALSTLFFISGFYFYLFPRSFSRRAFIAGALFACAYFTNYRLIIIPFLVGFCEFFFMLTERKVPEIRKFIWSILTFFLLVVVIGNLDKGQNAQVTFSWMFHQGEMARERFDWINLFSYPYYLFTLETFLFGLLFFGNLYLLLRRPGPKLLPFAIVCVQMIGFSFAGEKGARYLCVVTPFMVMAVSHFAWSFFEEMKIPAIKNAVAVICLIAVLCMTFKSFQIVGSRSDYRLSVNYLTALNPDAKILSTQPWVQNLYVQDKRNVFECPHNIRNFLIFHAHGFRYLVLCPQTYISWTKSGKRFDPELEDYLTFVEARVKPAKIFPHLNRVMLERFVFEHNENLSASIAFLRLNRHFGEIRIYNTDEILGELSQWMPKRPKTSP